MLASRMQAAQRPASQQSSFRRASTPAGSKALPAKHRRQLHTSQQGRKGDHAKALGRPATRDESLTLHRDMPPLPPSSPSSGNQWWSTSEKGMHLHGTGSYVGGSGRLGYGALDKADAGQPGSELGRLMQAGHGHASFGKASKGSRHRGHH